MNAEALIGTVLGTSTLQQLIGQGGMGAVYLAQQSRPRRQVAVKILMPATALKPHQLSAFLERFRRETDAAASLEHPNIMPVYEYGERGGLAYLVMPYISGGTLRDVMERDGQLAFSDAQSYLEQMAAALDFAHSRGVIHRDIKPANMLLTPDGRLLLTDFGLVKLLSDNQPEQMRLTGAGAPVGTPDYMSPEQVIGGEVDGRADQYSMGVVLFQMLTGLTPFQGETPIQIASQQLHMQPPAPRLLRPDLPEAAEKALLRAMAKRPEERFSTAQDFAVAFRLAFTSTSAQPGLTQNRGGGLLSSSNMRKGSLFDPKWQNTSSIPTFGATQIDASAQTAGAPAAALSLETGTNIAVPRPGGTGLLSRTGFFPRMGDNTGTMPAASVESNPVGPAAALFSTGQMPTATAKRQAMPGQPGGLFAQSTPTSTQQDISPQQMGFQSSLFVQPDVSAQQTGFQSSFFAQPSETSQQQFSTSTLQQLSPTLSPTSTLSLLNPEQKAGNTIKLTGPVKVVQVPVAPGQYVTGLLPVQKELEEPAEAPASPKKSTARKIILLLAVFLVLAGGLGGVFALTHAHTNAPQATQTNNATTPPNPTATAMAEATATETANIIFDDPLSQNIHNFPSSSTSNGPYVFADGAYHITNQSSNGAAVVVRENFTQTTLGYQLTMEELKGDDTSPNNTFGMILRYNETTTKGKTVYTFYTFELLNENGASQYGFYKYDSSKSSPWSELWHTNTGKEFHGGQGPKAVNIIKVFANGSQFTFFVNGKQVGTFKDSSYKSGSMGMLINLKGTEVAFSNMLITRN